MADKNQPSLANGAPPQFPLSNPIVRPNLYNQAQTRHPPGADHSLNSSLMQKPPISIVNGQVPLSVRSTNWPQGSGYSNSAGDSASHQLPSGQPPLQATRPNFSFPGSSPKVTQSLYTPLNQQNPPASTSEPYVKQVSSDVQSGQQNIIKPSPVMASRVNVPTSGTAQIGDGASQGLLSQHQVNPPVPVSQYSGTPSAAAPPPSSQINKPLYGPPTSIPPPKSSPYSKFTVSNPSYSQRPPPLSQEMKSSPYHQNLQGSLPIRPQYANDSQTSLPPTSQSGPSQYGFPGVSQGFQPTSIAPNPILQPPMSQPSMSQPLMSQPPMSQPPLSKPPMSQPQISQPPLPGDRLTNSGQGTPTYHNQYPGNRNVGPPPTGSGVPMSSGVPPQPNLAHHLPTQNNSYGSMKPSGINSLTQGFNRMSVTQQGFNKLWGMETVDLLQCRNILPPQKVTPPPIRLQQEFMENVNCSPEIFCCTLNKIPETNSLLQKSRLPLGILIHPFRDLKQLAVIQCSSIVRCRACRTYINPFVYFVDNKRWKCNLCFRVNELPDEFQYDPVSKTYGDPSRRPEIRSSTIEFIAPSEYMLRPPQPAIYLFVLDVSRWGCDTGYLETFCAVLLEELDNIPGDSRTQIGFILFDSTIHFFSIAESYNQAHEMIVSDIDDVFLPTPDTLLVNLNENRQLIKDLLHEIPRKYAESFDTDSALGPALQAAYKLMSPTGGRITVFQSCLPNKGPGALSPREDPNQRSSREVRHLGPQTDFYKRLALDCSTQQISVDLFLVSSQYSDLATLGGVSQFSGGCMYHFPLFRRINPENNERLARAFRRYLTRKIGFEAVMRVRCSRGLSIHTFHGNFFVRSTDLLSLPNVNPDAGFGMQIAIEDSLLELQCVCFQAAVLYTSAKGERRIRVHTLCLPVSSNLSDILTSADQQAIIGLLGKMAVDRSLKSSLSDAREAFINAAMDILSAYKLVETSGGQNTLLAPVNLSLIPLYILALLKSTAFRTGQSTRLDDRVYAMSQMKTLPLRELIQLIHPDLYHVTHLDDETGVEFEDKPVAQPARLSLSSEHLDSRGAFLLDTPEVIYLLVGKNVSTEFLVHIFDVRDIRQISKDLVELPELENDDSEKLRHFINFLQSEKSWPAVTKVVTEPGVLAPFFINDKAENALSYYELLHHVKAQLK